MHAISSYRGNRPTNKQIHNLTGAITIQCAATSLPRSVINNIVIANFNPENPGSGTPKSRNFGIGKRAGIPGFRGPGINSLIALKQSNLRHLPYYGPQTYK